MISKKANAIYKVLKLMNFKESMDFSSPRRTNRGRVPLLLYLKNNVEKMEIRDRNVYNIFPTSGMTEQHVIFFHGGGYASEASINHFLMINKFIDLTQCTVTFVEYPLAPEANVHETLAMAYETYLGQIKAYPEHRFTLMGDSAGGGLALALAMLIRDNLMNPPDPTDPTDLPDSTDQEYTLKQPEKLILFSPWLDIGLTNPNIVAIEERDLILNLSALLEVGKKYAYDLLPDDYRVSPLYGELNQLGSILIFYGSDEILKPDCAVFCGVNTEPGTTIKGIEYEEMQHDWVVLPIPEQEQALEEAAQFLMNIV